jgi:hypothetical protein
MRPFAQQLYGIPPERVIGSAFGLDLRLGEEDTNLLYKSEIDFFDDGPEKPVRTWSRTGRRPLGAAGNSNGDIPMLRFARQPGRTALRLLILHDDPEREFDYVADAEEALQRAKECSWTVVSVKNERLGHDLPPNLTVCPPKPQPPHACGPAETRACTKTHRRHADCHILHEPALVAQRIEHLTTDQKAGGSSPSERADVLAGQSLILRGGQGAESLSRAWRLTISHSPKRSCESWRARPGPVAGLPRSHGRRSSA